MSDQNSDMNWMIRQRFWDMQNRRNGVIEQKPRGGNAGTGAGTQRGLNWSPLDGKDMNRQIRVETGRKGLRDY